MKHGNNMPADKLTKTQGGMAKGNTAKTSRSPNLSNSGKHGTKHSAGMKGNKFTACNYPKGA